MTSADTSINPLISTTCQNHISNKSHCIWPKHIIRRASAHCNHVNSWGYRESAISLNYLKPLRLKATLWITRVFANTVYIGFCDQPLSEGSGLLNPKEVAKSSVFQLDITTRRSQNTSLVVADHILLDITTNTGCYLLNKRQNLRSLNTRSLFMYWRRSVMGFAVVKVRLAA